MKVPIKIIHWLPRIICMLAILFISLFATDAFNHGHTIRQQLGDFFMHLIPSFVLTLFLIVAWKWELAGGILFTLIGLALSPYIFHHNHTVNHFSIGQSVGVIMMISFPFVVVGVLFIISHQVKKKQPFNTNTG